jgi:hypothetical protein
MVRTALIYFIIGFAAAAMMLAAHGLESGPWVSRLRAVHIELLLVGWMVRLAVGVASWILPRFRAGTERGREWLAWTAFALLNAGVLSTVAGGAGVTALAGLLGRSAEALAAMTFALHAWPRIKAFG